MPNRAYFQIFLGIDQTGATDAKGVPRPLHVTLIDKRKGLKVYPRLKLKKLNYEEISSLLEIHLKNYYSEKILICVDSVLGLPHEIGLRPRTLFKKIRSYSYNTKSYGAITAHAFFNQFVKGQAIPHREVELKVKANSVFNLQPFQKNIGCGSYRILRDLSENTGWFSLWPFEEKESQFVIAEGYPSYFWKSLMGSKKRDLALLNKTFQKLNLDNLDQADSFLLALGASKNCQQIFNFKKTTKSHFEGWILGVPNDD